MSRSEPEQFQLKRLTQSAIPAAIERAEQYRLLNEPELAESICLDVLEIDPDNQPVLVMLLLAVTDQFVESVAGKLDQAKKLLHRINDEYQRAYYHGLIHEREARAFLHRASPGAGYAAHQGLTEAMRFYEDAEKIRPAESDEALLRWNTCVRTIQSGHLEPAPADDTPLMLE
jgi:tetratricopeptide (TPR) repeat protein